MPSVRGVDLRRELANNPPDGLTPVRARLRNDALALIESEDLVEASYSYCIVPLDRPAAATLHVGGETLYAPKLLPESGELTAIGFGVCTLGPKLEARGTALFGERRASLSVALEYVGTEMLFALGRRVQDRMLSECYRRRLTMAGELHAGDPGLDISAQATVLRLAEAESIGVRLYGDHLLTPIKSTTLVLGVGKDLPATSWSRCDTCPSKAKCSFGRRSLREEGMVA
jgi:hypothetical protein